MLRWLEYIALGYIALGIIIYIYGHPKTFRASKARSLNNESGLEKTMISTSGRIDRYAAHAAQMVNFMTHRTLTAARGTYRQNSESSLNDLYTTATEKAFRKSNFFITTGSPHSRALFLRNFAWFYPTLLDPNTIANADDGRRRVVLLNQSLSIVLTSMGSKPYTTTLVPLTPRRLASVNYVKQPSDSLLGILSGIEMLVNANSGHHEYLDSVMTEARNDGLTLIRNSKADLKNQVDHLIKSLREFNYAGTKTLLIDSNGSKSSATDTRFEKRRFVTNANVWSTFNKAIKLGIMSNEELNESLGRTLKEYKAELLSIFGKSGVITNSLDDYVSGKPNIVLDFAHVHNGFWSFETREEIELFRNTTDAITNNPEFLDDSGNCFLVSAVNPKIRQFQHFVAASYHGRTVWPAFNVGFADRLIDLSIKTGDNKYRDIAIAILIQLEVYILENNCYPEILNPDGRPYSTWVYRSAEANSWFPYFMSVKARIN